MVMGISWVYYIRVSLHLPISFVIFITFYLFYHNLCYMSHCDITINCVFSDSGFHLTVSHIHLKCKFLLYSICMLTMCNTDNDSKHVQMRAAWMNKGNSRHRWTRVTTGTDEWGHQWAQTRQVLVHTDAGTCKWARAQTWTNDVWACTVWRVEVFYTWVFWSRQVLMR
jgi:hypothetical protein